MIDSHCHIDEPAYAEDREDMLQRQKDDGVEAIIIPGVDKLSISGIFDVCRRHPAFCYPVLGLHPQNVEADWQEQLAVLHEAVIAHTAPGLPVSERIVAIGEIGLDYHYTREFEVAQHEVFRTQLRWARELELPVIIHSRDATADSLRIVREEIANAGNGRMGGDIRGKVCRGVVHCFSGSAEVAKQWLELGLYLGIGGVLTFKNSHLADNLRQVPLERILLETDGPYLAPTPHRGERNEPRFIRLVAEHLSTLYGCTVEEVIRITSASAKELFGI